LGDSKSRFFRAFELIPIEGIWRADIEGVLYLEGKDPTSRVRVPSAPGDVIEQFESLVNHAQALGQFVAVGSPYLEEISACPVSADELSDLKAMDCSPAAFEQVHRFIKNWKSKH
jgi:hypothetical protein